MQVAKHAMSHGSAAFLAIVVEIALLAGFIFGDSLKFKNIGVRKTFRDTPIALWVALVPAWLTAESTLYAPVKAVAAEEADAAA
ncbi:hypothetical protein [Sphingomonas sp. BK235]|uniref:hypothetical protein n=1 Tax=Sphingomonas sp. BK235 TaxID=2512131 RepID=UPI00104761AA|nr:hypothetical protein [Sphingomonas sp. BK235]